MCAGRHLHAGRKVLMHTSRAWFAALAALVTTAVPSPSVRAQMYGVAARVLATGANAGELDTAGYGGGDGVAMVGGAAPFPTGVVFTDVVVDLGGRTVAVGTSSLGGIFIARFTSAGVPDSTFGGGDGWAVTQVPAFPNVVINAIAMHPNSTLMYVGGSTGEASERFFVARINGSSGALDTSWNGGLGYNVTDFTTSTDEYVNDLVVLDSNGAVAAVGSASISGDRQFAITRYYAHGPLYEFFDGDSGTGNGKVVTNWTGTDAEAHAVRLHQGFLYVAGTANGRMAVARYLSTWGRLDKDNPSTGYVGFNVDGKTWLDLVPGQDDIAYDVVIDSSNRVVLGGGTSGQSGMKLCRFTTTGSHDSTFKTAPLTHVHTQMAGLSRVFSLEVQGTSVIAVGQLDLQSPAGQAIAVMRYTSTGSPDVTFSGDGLMTIEGSSVHDTYAALGSSFASDKLVVAGFNWFLCTVESPNDVTCDNDDDDCDGVVDDDYVPQYDPCGEGICRQEDFYTECVDGVEDACEEIPAWSTEIACNGLDDNCDGETDEGACCPITCAEANAECGEASDGCGGSQQCGTCPGNGICIENLNGTGQNVCQ